MMSKRILMVGAALIALVAMACAGGDETVAPAPQPETAAQPAPAAPTAEAMAEATPAMPMEAMPKSGGRLNIWRTSDPTIWDVGRGVQGDTDPFNHMIYESLAGYQIGEDAPYDTTEVEPVLAESWEISPDATAFTWKLRKGVKFANLDPVNGRELTSADVKFALEYLSRTGEFAGMKEYFTEIKLARARYAYMVSGIESIETPDKYTAIVNFSEPFAPYLKYAAHIGTRVTPREIYDADGHFRDRAVGTGPFQMDWEESQPGARWLVQKNPDYWQEGKPYLDTIFARVIPDASTAFAGFRVGQLDVMHGSGHTIVDTEAQELKRDNPNAVVAEFTGPTPRHLYLNVRRPPFDDLRVRRAVDLAIDRDEFIKVFEGGKGGVALAGAFPDTFTQEEIRGILRYDLEESKRLLAEAGYSDGLDLEFFMSTRYGQNYVAQAELFQAQLAKVGIRLTLKSFQHPEYLTLTRGNTFDLTFRGKGVSGDVDSYVRAVFLTGEGRNYSGIEDPELDAVLKAQAQEPDPAKRRELVRKAVLMIHDKAWNLAIWRGTTFLAWQDHVKNYTPSWQGSNRILRHVWLDK
jgi:peptide/nickel transport system substrate-binding protein